MTTVIPQCSSCRFGPFKMHKKEIGVMVCSKFPDKIDWRIIEGKRRCPEYKLNPKKKHLRI